jgi:hypothetical protein
MQILGLCATALGLVLASVHGFRRRDDLWGIGIRVFCALLIGYAVTHPPILTISDAAF